MKTLGILFLAFIFSAPFAVVYPLLPFVVLGLLYALSRLRLKHPLENLHRARGFILAAIFLVPVAFIVPVLEGGVFASGPFYGANFNGDIQTLTATDSVAYGSGELISYEADKNHAPVLAYVVDGKARWATEMQTGNDSTFKIYKVTGLRVSYGLLRNRVEFFATGTSEPGWAFVWKFGGVQKFFLKIF